MPLSDAALAILEKMRGRHERLVFASDRAIGKPVSGEGIRKLVPGCDAAWIPYQFSGVGRGGRTGAAGSFGRGAQSRQRRLR